MKVVRQLIFLWLPLLLGLAGCASTPDPVATKYHALGRADAQRDLERGRLAYEGYGYFGANISEIIELLHDRCQVEYRCVGGCTAGTETVEHARGYNEVMIPEIERRFGRDVWAKTETDAEELYKSRKGLK